MCRDDKCVFYVQECQVCYLCAGMTSVLSMSGMTNVLSMCRDDKCVVYVQGMTSVLSMCRDDKCVIYVQG